MTPRVAVVQDGARLHYAVPLAFQQEGLLERVFVEWASPPGSPEALAARLVGAVAPAAGRRMADRWCGELDPAKVVRNPLLALRLRAVRRRYTTDEEYWEAFSGRVAGWVRRRGFGRATHLFGFVRHVHPALLADARKAGLATIADQIIAPAATEQAQFAAELARWPGWHPGGQGGRDLGRVDALERKTWAAADRLTCGSGYVRDELARHGVDPARVTVAPYPVPPTAFVAPERPAGRSVTVGFVGGVGVRKGAGYFAGVARRLAGPGVRFVMVGPVQLSAAGEGAVREAGVELVGSVPRSAVAGWLTKFDVFVFPSTCEGSASSVLEAMAAGLPVVCSPESGSVITDGTDGFVRRYDDADGLAAAVGRLCGDPGLRAAVGAAGRRAAEGVNQRNYAGRLAGVARGTGGDRPGAGC